MSLPTMKVYFLKAGKVTEIHRFELQLYTYDDEDDLVVLSSEVNFDFMFKIMKKSSIVRIYVTMATDNLVLTNLPNVSKTTPEAEIV
ncbi:hypothetical protein WMY93_033581 [Mugilogobius chulae]|uniref:PB1 domain-containing protein n=1 Tax=Mugilogobius chulae TaxID=88201 RepID=A0AAW0MHR3_9GOBI